MAVTMPDYVFVVTITNDDCSTTQEYESRLLALKDATNALIAVPSAVVTIEARYTSNERFKSIQQEFFTKLADSGISNQALSGLLGYTTFNEYLTWKEMEKE